MPSSPHVRRPSRAALRAAPAAALRAARAAPPALLALVVAGLALRALALVAWQPAALVHFDSIAYLDAAETGLFDDPIHPAGYAAFLRAAGLAGDALWPVIALQHLLGVAAALLVHGAARRGGAAPGPAVAAAAVPLLAGDVVFLEHAVMSEALFLPLVAAALYAVVRALEPASPQARLGWLAGAGALLAAAALVRSVGLALLPALALAAVALAPAWPPRGAGAGRLAGLAPRAAAGAAVALPALAVLALYLGAQSALSDRPGFTEVGGWALYGRAAPFADCDRFEPPAGTEPLCEATPPERRPGGDFYAWVGGPARAAFGAPPRRNDDVGAFARAAIAAQPLDYARAVMTDLARYVDPDAGRERPYTGDPPEEVAFTRREPDAERASIDALERLGRPVEVRRAGGLGALEAWGRAVRLHGLLLAALLALGVAGSLAGRGRARAPAAAAALIGAALLAAPALTGFYNARYAVPAAPALALAGALGVAALRARAEPGRQGPAASTASSDP